MNSPFDHDLYPILPRYELRESCRATRQAGKGEPTHRRSGRDGEPGVCGGVRRHAADLRALRVIAEQDTRGQRQYRRSAANHPEPQTACFMKRTFQARSRYHLRQDSLDRTGSQVSKAKPIDLTIWARFPGTRTTAPAARNAGAVGGKTVESSLLRVRSRSVNVITVRSSPARST